MVTGIIGRKVGMTQIFDEDGTAHPATVIKAGPCVVVQMKGAQTDGRSPVFAPNAQSDYTLQLPDPADRLVGAQVQQFGPPPQADPETGEIEFPIRASWVLNTSG